MNERLPIAESSLGAPTAVEGLERALATLCRSLRSTGAAVLQCAGTGMVAVAAHGTADHFQTFPFSVGDPITAAGQIHPLYASGQLEGYLVLATPVFEEPGGSAVLDLTLDLTAFALRQIRLLAEAGAAEQIRQIREMAASESYLRTLHEAIPCGLLIYDTAGRLIQANVGAQEILGQNLSAMVGRAPQDVVRFLREDASDMPPEEIPSRIVLRTGAGVRGVIMGVAQPGIEPRWLSVDAAPVPGPDGQLERILVMFFDITARREAEQALRHQAGHDALTGLPNRLSFHAHLQSAVQDTLASGAHTAMLLLDIDRFREVNDTLGHRTGDLLVRQIGEHLQGTLEAGAIIARLGGDEFAILLPHAGTAMATAAAASLLEGLARPFHIEGQLLDVDASIGIAICPDHGADADTLLRRADIAMYVAKRAKDGLAIYTPQLDMHSPDRLALLSDLRRAIAQDQFFLCYQPQQTFGSRRMRGVEALARWRHPQRGLVSPDEFIVLAEGTGAIKQLTLWVLDAALRQCRSWLRAGISLPVAVNLSPRNLQDATLPLAIGDLLDLRQVPADHLILEITESTIMADPDQAMEVLTRLSGMGIRLAIDDFGTGYSSLAYLKRLPAHEIKIDKSFVLRMSEDYNDAAIVRSIIDLGHNLGLEVVAEGVEDSETWDLLAALGCDTAQGYYLSRPLPAPELERWLDEQPPAGDSPRTKPRYPHPTIPR